MKRFLLLVASSAAAAALSGAGSGTAVAGDNYCGPSANGCDHAMANTPCAGHGGFGAFGAGNNFAGGASGDRTGYYNSTLCGNPQGSAGTLGDHPH